MTRVSSEQSRLMPWYAKAGAASSIVPLARWVSPKIFVTKDGGYGMAAHLTGRDEESLTDQEIESGTRTLRGALRGLPEDACLRQYSRVLSGYEIPRKKSYGDPVLGSFVNDRLEYLEANAGFRRIDLFWCLTFEPSQKNPLGKKPKDAEGENTRRLAMLRKTASILETQLGPILGLRFLDKTEAFPFFSYLFNLEPWAEHAQLQSDMGLDRQIVRSPVAIEGDHLRLGKRYVQMFTLTNSPEVSRPCQFSGLMTLDCDSVLCTTWRPKSAAKARAEITQQEKFISFFKVGVLSRVMSGSDTASLEYGAGARAADAMVDGLSEVTRSLDNTGQGEFTMRLLLAARSREQLHDTIPSVHRLFVDARCQVMEETLGNLSAFFSMFPGNSRFSIFPMWLSEDHNARLALIYAPSIGHPHSEDLDNEYLNVFETRTKTPFFQDPFVAGVKVGMVLGPTGSGKSVHQNQHIAMELKYGGFIYIFDIGGSYESVVELYGGRVDRVGKDGPRVNPFSLEPTEDNLKFLYSFIKLLLTNGGAELSPEDEDVIFSAVRGMYQLDAENRRLSNLLLPKHLNRYLSKWTDTGVYAAIFDNVHDELELGRVQCFDFQGVNTAQYADLIEPLMVWLLRRINAVLYDPTNLGVPTLPAGSSASSPGSRAAARTCISSPTTATSTSVANSALSTKPSSSNAAQVNNFQQQQRLLEQKDAEERQRQAVLAAQNAELQQEQSVPGPESPNAEPMTQAQRDAMYGKNNPNAPQRTSGQSQAQAEARQRQIERERQRQEALNSDTVAIDFAKTAPASATGNGSTAVVEAASANAPAGSAVGEDLAPERADFAPRPTTRPVSSETLARKDPMAQYDFDGFQGRLYRVFEGTVLEGVLTNHIDGGFAGPMIVMLTTDYYSHDHQQLLLPQGTRLIGNVQSVSGSGQRKLFVTFNRAICPDGFSLDLNRFTGLDPLGTTGLATSVNNHYLSSFAAAAAVGGIGGLAQVGNSGTVLDANTQIRNGISTQTAQESEQILNKFLNRLPVITVKEGSRARVYINQDILIPSYAEHRVDPSL